VTRDAGPHKPTVVLPDAVTVVREFFARQCGPLTLTTWAVVAAYESLERGVHVIRCLEGCLLDAPREHEVWVDSETGLIVRTQQVRPGGAHA
jgi:hypothetical protein